MDEEKIKQIFFKVFENLNEKDFSFEKKQIDYENWDSFAHMQIISEIESQFNINLNVDEVTSIESARDILEVINKKKNE